MNDLQCESIISLFDTHRHKPFWVHFSAKLSQSCSDASDDGIQSWWQDCPKLFWVQNLPLLSYPGSYGSIGKGHCLCRCPLEVGVSVSPAHTDDNWTWERGAAFCMHDTEIWNSIVLIDKLWTIVWSHVTSILLITPKWYRLGKRQAPNAKYTDLHLAIYDLSVIR